jgi:hypothetical protein
MNSPVARYCLLMRCVQVRHTSIQLPVMLISPFSGTDEEDERRPECDFSGAGITRVTSLSTVAVTGCPGRCRLAIRYSCRLGDTIKGTPRTTVVSPTIMLPVKFAV